MVKKSDDMLKEKTTEVTNLKLELQKIKYTAEKEVSKIHK